MEKNIKNISLRDAVYGAVIGDALGVPYEFMERGSFKCTDMTGYGTHYQPEGTWSDDSSLLLATAKGIKDNSGKIDTKDIMNNFRKWLYRGEFSPFGEVFDIGGTTRNAIVSGAGEDSVYSNGNGSLMRILPLAFTDCTDDEIREVSALTHAHHISKEGCVIYVNIIRECLKGRDLRDVIRELSPEAPYDRIPHIDELPIEEINSGGYVVSTLEAAIWCVLTSKSITECLIKAVNLGSDTDTTACVAGGLGAVVFGIGDIPSSWMEKIKNRELIEECIF